LVKYRQRDINIFFIGLFIFLLFIIVIIISLVFGKFELVPELVSSAVISQLTLTLIWIELSKRPELTLRGLAPIIYRGDPAQSMFAANLVNELPQPSFFWGIVELHTPVPSPLQFLSFQMYVANVGYDEIMISEYVAELDKMKPIGRLLQEKDTEGVLLKAQQRHKIMFPSLGLEKPGFHKLKLGVYASTTGVSTEIWFSVSNDLTEIRYMRTSPFLSSLGSLTRRQLSKNLPKEKQDH
jgi:hypothetical protein